MFTHWKICGLERVKNCVGIYKDQECWLALLNPIFLFFMISLESLYIIAEMDYYCWNYTVSLTREKTKLNNLLQIIQLMPLPGLEYGPFDFQPVVSCLWSNSREFNISRMPGATRHAGSLYPFEAYILALVLVWDGWILLCACIYIQLKGQKAKGQSVYDSAR